MPALVRVHHLELLDPVLRVGVVVELIGQVDETRAAEDACAYPALDVGLIFRFPCVRVSGRKRETVVSLQSFFLTFDPQ